MDEANKVIIHFPLEGVPPGVYPLMIAEDPQKRTAPCIWAEEKLPALQKAGKVTLIKT